MALAEYTPETLNRTADHFLVRDTGDPFHLDTPYQRQSVWTVDQRRNLIKSLRMGLPVGAVWTNERTTNDAHHYYGVIDGRQRIETIRMWFASEFGVPRAWFDLPSHAADRSPWVPPGNPDDIVTYADLTDNGQRMCRNRWHLGELHVRGLTIEQEADLYLLVNFGGVAQTAADQARAAAVATTKEF